MKLTPRHIPKFQTGNNLWYQNLVGRDYDPNNYTYNYDTSTLVDGDMGDQVFKPWLSNIAGYDKGRYVPTSGHGAFGVGGSHYNYTKGVEGQNYYQKFGKDILDENGNFTEMGKQWAKAVDALIPASNHLARFYDDKGNLRTSWSTGHNDAHGRAPKTYNSLRDYVNAVRNDQILGARHNVFLNKGKRYFYKDQNGVEHWVNPEDIGNYSVSKDPIRSNWNNDHTIYWDDYELTGPGNGPENPTTDPARGSIVGRHTPGNKFDLNTLREGFSKIAPDLLKAGRLALGLNTNRRMYEEQLKASEPQLQGSYHTYRQVVGDEGTKQAYYRRAAEGETRAAQPWTSDSDRQMAYNMEARRVGNELRAQGDLADNQEIRRTSDESNQHQWQNIARDNQIANHNYLARLQAEAQKHLLASNRLAADYTSLNNYLLGYETERERAKQEANNLATQAYMLDSENKLLNDSSYQALYSKVQDEYNKALERHTNANGDIDYIAARNDPEFKKAQLAFQNRQYQMRRQQLLDLYNIRTNRGFLGFAKNGMKVTFKTKDDLLYKTAKDAVDHYRRMVKMSDSSMLRSFKKPIKLVGPPKSTVKMQTGGVAPFVVYTPAPSGVETSTSSQVDNSLARQQAAASTKKSDKGDSTLDVIKDLFKGLEGLPADVNGVYKNMQAFLERSRALGTEIDADDLASIYLQNMQQINNIKFSKNNYDAAYKHAESMDALDEFAVNDAGQFLAQNTNGDLEYKSWEEIKKGGWNPLTNNQVLNIRAYSKEYMLGKGDMSLLTVVNKGIGVTKIAEFIKSNMPKLGSDEQTIEGYTKKQSNDIAQGFQQLLQDAPDGEFKWQKKTEEQKKQIQAAFGYMKAILPKNMRAILKAHADTQGITTDQMLASLLAANASSTNDLTFDAVTGKAAKGTNGSGGSDKGELKLDAASALISGVGYSTPIEFNTGSSYAVTVNARESVLQKHSGENMGNGITLQDATQSTLSGVLDWNKATIGGSRIIPTAYSHILINNGEVAGVDLPVGSDKSVPNFEMLKQLEKLDDELLKSGIQDVPENWQQVNQLCQKLGIPNKYTGPGKLNTHNWNRFAAIQGITDDKALVDKNVILDMLGRANNDVRDLYEEVMKSKPGNSKFKLDSGWFSKTELYQGTIFIPIKQDYVQAALSGGQDISVPKATDLKLKQMGYDQAKAATYKAPTITLEDLKQ